jgi:DNA-binding transcriptional LysR family regulator
MLRPGAPSLDQLAVFLTVVETGSFAAAGRRFGRATSAVSYAIANLEQQLGVQLFDRDQARRPASTEAVGAVLSEARSVSEVSFISPCDGCKEPAPQSSK